MPLNDERQLEDKVRSRSYTCAAFNEIEAADADRLMQLLANS